MAKKISIKQLNKPMPIIEEMAKFENAFAEFKSGGLPITKEQYIQLRLKMVEAQSKGMIETHLKTNTMWAAQEYETGGTAVQSVLKWVWDTYIGGKIKNQMIANILFQLILKGIDNAYQAILKWLKGKNALVGESLQESVAIASQIAENSDLELFKNELTATLQTVLKENSSEAPKMGFFKRLWQMLKSII